MRSQLIAALPLLAQSVVAAPLATLAATSYRNMVYYLNTDMSAGYAPSDMNTEYMTHVIYAFADIAKNGTVYSTSDYDTQPYANEDPSGNGTNVYGNVKQLFQLKQQNRNLKTLLSIGGATYGPNFAYAFKNRETFCDSAIELMNDWGFDGIDLDYEIIASKNDGEQYYQVLKQCRAALDAYQTKRGDGYHFLLTAAMPAGAANYNNLDFSKIVNRVDNVLLMAYDLDGSWSSTTGHMAAVHKSTTNPESTKIAIEDVVSDYVKDGMTASKIILGLPLYGRSFAKTTGLGKKYGGVGGDDGTGSGAGIYLFKNLPRKGATVSTDTKVIAEYSYQSDNKEFVSFDGKDSTNLKADWLKKTKLGGAMFWRAYGDKTGDASLVKVMNQRLGSMKKENNQINFPDSKYDNIKNGMVE